jgi:hypothetical protein
MTAIAFNVLLRILEIGEAWIVELVPRIDVILGYKIKLG